MKIYFSLNAFMIYIMLELYMFNTFPSAVFREKRELFSILLCWHVQSAVGIINKAICIEGQMKIRRLAPFSFKEICLRSIFVC